MPNWKHLLDPHARGGRYLPWKEVARATGLSRTTAWRLQKRGEFPAPYAISPGRVGFREDEVEAWRASRDHSSPKTRPRTEPSSRPGGVAPSPTGAVQCDSAAPQQHLAECATSAPRTPPASVSAPPKPGRRRSEHAKAIAQQILFDF